MPKAARFVGTEGRVAAARGRGRRGGRVIVEWGQLQFGKMNSSGDLLPNNVNVLNIAEMCTLEGLRRHVLHYMHFTTN